jgi:hypothetical protein
LCLAFNNNFSTCFNDFSSNGVKTIAYILCPLNSNNNTQAPEQITTGPYIYRAIATNLEILNDSKIVHFYNQRAEDSESRIKELKNDFSAKQMPCADFNANALYYRVQW